MFATYSLLGVGGCLFVWITDASPFSQLGAVGGVIPLAGSGGTGFLGGIELAILFLMIAFFGIVVFYALAELTVVLVEIALNTRGLHNTAAVSVPASQPAPQPSPLPISQPSATVCTPRHCKKCGQPLDAGSTFCAECGTQVR
jgi:hypothetical protein